MCNKRCIFVQVVTSMFLGKNFLHSKSTYQGRSDQKNLDRPLPPNSNFFKFQNALHHAIIMPLMQLFKHRTILCIISPILCLLSQTNIDCYICCCNIYQLQVNHIPIYLFSTCTYLFTYDSHPHRIIGGIYGICIEIEKKEIPTCSDMLLPIKYRREIRLRAQ